MVNAFFAFDGIPSFARYDNTVTMGQGQYVREWRIMRKLSQRRLADRLDMSYANLSRIESGKIGYTRDTLTAISEVLGCAQADLLRPPPTQEDAPLWDIVQSLSPDVRRQALRILRALAEGDERYDPPPPSEVGGAREPDLQLYDTATERPAGALHEPPEHEPPE